eukprot:5259845-Pyramimonas_sp.AAC.2
MHLYLAKSFLRATPQMLVANIQRRREQPMFFIAPFLSASQQLLLLQTAPNNKILVLHKKQAGVFGTSTLPYRNPSTSTFTIPRGMVNGKKISDDEGDSDKKLQNSYRSRARRAKPRK